MPSRILDLFNMDYQIFVINIHDITEKEIEHFNSDYKIVLDYFHQIRTAKAYRVPPHHTITHPDVTPKLMTALTDEHNFEEQLNRVMMKKKKKDEKINTSVIIAAIKAEAAAKATAEATLLTEQRIFSSQQQARRFLESCGRSEEVLMLFDLSFLNSVLKEMKAAGILQVGSIR